MHRFTYSNVVATIALVLAVGGGTAVAATHLAVNSVGTAQIRDRSVAVRDLARSARPPSKARIAQAVTDTLTTGDVLDALKGAVQGAPGREGPAGPAGPAGPQGSPGLANVTVEQADGPTTSGPGYTGATARCPDGERAIGGGGRFDAAGDVGAVMTQSMPTDDGNGWIVSYSRGNGPTTGHAHAFAVCAVTS